MNFALKTIYETKQNLFLHDFSQEEKIQTEIISLMSKINIKENSLFPDNSMNNSSLEEIQKMVISKLQENIKIRRVMTYEISNGFFFDKNKIIILNF